MIAHISSLAFGCAQRARAALNTEALQEDVQALLGLEKGQQKLASMQQKGDRQVLLPCSHACCMWQACMHES